MLHHIRRFSTRMPSLPLDFTTFSAQGCRSLSSSPSPTKPAQGPGEGGKPQDLVAYLKYVAFFLSLLVLNEGYYVYLACRGDVPIKNRQEDGLWIPSTNPDMKALLEEVRGGKFYMMLGWPGVGKTTQVCNAARDRGAAIYLDGAARNSFKDIQAAIDQRYRSLRLDIMSWITSKPESGLETLSSLAFWVKLFRRKNLVFIVDHIDKLAAADVLELVSWAKTQADGRRITVILVGSEQSTRLISNSDTKTRGELVMCYPPSAKETREALTKLISTHPDKYNLNVEECLYLRGTCPTEYVAGGLCATAEALMVQLKAKHARFEWQGRDFGDVDFWFKLLVAGSNGVSLVKGVSLVDDVALEMNKHYVPDLDKVLSEPCILYYNDKVYFISGCSREIHAALVISAYSAEAESLFAGVARLSVEVAKLSAEVAKLSAEVASLSAEVASLSAEVERMWFSQFRYKSQKLAEEKEKQAEEQKKLAEEQKKLVKEEEKLVKEVEKLVTAKERIVKIQECMSKKSYEAYGPL